MDSLKNYNFDGLSQEEILSEVGLSSADPIPETPEYLTEISALPDERTDYQQLIEDVRQWKSDRKKRNVIPR